MKKRMTESPMTHGESNTMHETLGKTSTQCPRCGYDLRGVTASWEDACPMTGVCAECGLQFVWAEVIRPDKFEPRWCVEFRSKGRFPVTAWRTFLKSLRPWRFWRELKMSHDIRWRRIAGYLLVFILILLPMYALEQSAVAIRVRYLQQQEMQRFLAIQQREVVALNRRIAALRSDDPSDPELLQLQWSLTRLNSFLATPPSINCSYILAVVEAVFTPMRSISKGSLRTVNGVTSAYIAPNQLHQTLFSMESRIFQVSSASGLRLDWILVFLCFQLAMLPGLPLGFLLLPLSRRRAKVRWRHLFRVTAYSIYLPMTVLLGLVFLINIGLCIPPIRTGCLFVGRWAFLVAIPAGLIAWWALAIRHYLKIPHGWLVAPALAMTTFLVVVAILFNAWPSLLIDL